MLKWKYDANKSHYLEMIWRGWMSSFWSLFFKNSTGWKIWYNLYTAYLSAWITLCCSSIGFLLIINAIVYSLKYNINEFSPVFFNIVNHFLSSVTFSESFVKNFKISCKIGQTAKEYLLIIVDCILLLVLLFR